MDTDFTDHKNLKIDIKEYIKKKNQNSWSEDKIKTNRHEDNVKSYINTI